MNNETIWNKGFSRRSLTAACFLSFAWGSAASLADEIKIGVVDTERSSGRVSTRCKGLEKNRKGIFAARPGTQENGCAGQGAAGHAGKRRAIPCRKRDRRNKERDLATLNREYQRAQRQMREDLSLRQNDEVAALQLTATKAIQVIAETEKYDLILPLRDLVYRSPRIDITEKVIKALADK